MHRMLEDKFQGQSLLDENDKNIISKIETYVNNLNSTINPEQLKRIVDIDRITYAKSSLDKQLQSIFDRHEIIRKILDDTQQKANSINIQELRESQPFETFKMFDSEHTLYELLHLPDDSNFESLTNGMKSFLKNGKARYEAIERDLAEIIAKGLQEYNSAGQTVKDYINYKQENGYIFEISENGRLLKISRSKKGPKFSVIYFDSNEKNSKGGEITQQKMVLYTGKDRALGFGSYGRVKLLQDYASVKWYAVKVQNTQGNKFYKIEVKNLKMVDMHLNDIELSSRNKHYVAMKLAEGVDALTLINEYIEPNINNDLDIIGLLLAAAKALQELHQNNMIHRDVKLENFVFNKENKECKLIDYQFLASIDDSGNFSDKTLMGTEGYFAQELEEARRG